MSGAWRAGWGVLCAIALAGSLGAQATARLRLDSALMLLGDPNRLVVTVEGAREVAGVNWAALDTMDRVVVTGPEQRERTPNGDYRLALPFSVYDSVGLVFPALPVYADGDTAYTNDVVLVVDFPPADSTFNDYRGIAAEPARLGDYLAWIVAAGVLLALLAAAFYFFYFRNRGAPAPAHVPPPDPAHVVALRRLGRLGLGDGLDDKAYYSELDATLRAYLSDRYGVPAPERTSGEVVALLRDRQLPSESELADLLAQVDLVKFARAQLPRERRAEASARVRAFVRATVPPPPPAAPSSPAPAQTPGTP